MTELAHFSLTAAPVACFKLYNGVDVVVQKGYVDFVNDPTIEERLALTQALRQPPIRWYNKPAAIQLPQLVDGEYWLCGPAIKWNTERFTSHVLVKKWGHPLEAVPLELPALQAWLAAQDIHGIRVQRVDRPDMWLDVLNDRRIMQDTTAFVRFSGQPAGEK